MKKIALYLLLIFSLILTGCSSPPTVNSEINTEEKQSIEKTIVTQSVEVEPEKPKVEIVFTDKKPTEENNYEGPYYIKVNGSNPYKGSLYMKIYMVSKDEEEIEEPEHLLPVLEFDDKQIEQFKESLESKGFSCQRWGALLPNVHNLPDEGDKVVLLHRNPLGVELYLTHVVAREIQSISIWHTMIICFV